MLQYVPFNPGFGTGAPGAHVPTTQWYFDTTGSPYLLYVYYGGAWVAAGAGGIDAHSLQGVAVSAAAPGANTKLTYVGANTDWEGV